MEETKRLMYEAPVMKVIELSAETYILQASSDGLGLPGYPAGTFPES